MKKLYTLALFCLFAIGSMAQYPFVPIDSIQRVPQDSLLICNTKSPFLGDTIRTRGVVMFNPRDGVLSTNFKNTYVIMENTLPNQMGWRGINVRIPFATTDSNITQFFDNFQPGNIVEFTGVVAEFFDANPGRISGETQIDLISVPTQVVGFQAPFTPQITSIANFMQSNGAGVPPTAVCATGEQFEGTYVEFQNVTVVVTGTFGGGRISWYIQDGNNNRIFIRDVSRFLRPPFASSTANVPANPNASVFLQNGKVFSYIRGFITETNFATGASAGQQYQLIPMDTTDIGPVLASPPVFDNITLSPIVPTSIQSVTIDAEISDIDGTVDTAFIHYSVGLGNFNFTRVSMSRFGNIWTGTIPPQANNAYVNYYLSAVDNDGNISYAPDTLATGSLYRVLDAGITQISQIQETPLAGGASIYNGRTISSNMNLTGTVMSTADINDLGIIVIQDSNNPFSGIIVREGPNNPFATAQRGDRVSITSATVQEIFSVTELREVTGSIISSGNVLPAPINVPIDSILTRRYIHTEPYESMLLNFDNVFVTSTNPDAPSNFGEWAFYHSTMAPAMGGLRADDVSFDIPSNFNTDSLTLNMPLNFIRGIFTFSFNNWKILPRNRNDIYGFGTTLQVAENKTFSGVRIYPNPANADLNIAISLAADEKTEIKILNTIGQVVNQQMVSLGVGEHVLTMPVGHLKNGIYILQINSKNKTATQKFVVTK